MPTETGRVIKRKRVNLPSGGTVDIPVITQITFLDVVAQGQEYEFHIENSAAAHRDVHIATVPGGGAATDESGGGDSDLKVERVDIWRVLDIVDHGQESFIHLDNKTVKEPPDAPPYFTTHEKTHLVKYINTPDDGNWIASELIDRFKVLDVVAQGQETEYFLFNPPDNTGISGLTIDTASDGTPTIAVDPNLSEISDSSNGVDPPWRTDPFQNIVNFSGQAGFIAGDSDGTGFGSPIYFSKNGLSWSALTGSKCLSASPGEETFNACVAAAANNGVWLLAGHGEHSDPGGFNCGFVFRSTDQSTWSRVPLPGIIGKFNLITLFYYDPKATNPVDSTKSGAFVMRVDAGGAGDPPARTYASVDGLSWTATTISDSFHPEANIAEGFSVFYSSVVRLQVKNGNEIHGWTGQTGTDKDDPSTWPLLTRVSDSFNLGFLVFSSGIFVAAGETSGEDTIEVVTGYQLTHPDGHVETSGSGTPNGPIPTTTGGGFVGFNSSISPENGYSAIYLVTPTTFSGRLPVIMASQDGFHWLPVFLNSDDTIYSPISALSGGGSLFSFH